MNQDLQDILAAWLDHAELDVQRCSELRERLKSDDAFRREIAEQVQMISLTRTVQSSEPRWLQLEELLEQSVETEFVADDFAFEERVAAKISRAEQGSGFGLLFRWLTGGLTFAAIGTALFVTAFHMGRVAERAGGETPVDAGASPVTNTIEKPAVAVLARTANAGLQLSLIHI